MKRLLFALLLALPLFSLAQKGEKINWISIEEAQELMKKEPRKIMIDVYTKWCGPCKMMSAKTFTDAKTVKYINENYYAVKFNAEGPDPVKFKGQQFVNPNYDPNKKGRNGTHQFAGIAQAQGRLAYPTLVFLDENLDILTPLPGYRTPKDLEPVLNWFGSNTYKTVQYDAYVKTFKSSY